MLQGSVDSEWLEPADMCVCGGGGGSNKCMKNSGGITTNSWHRTARQETTGSMHGGAAAVPFWHKQQNRELPSSHRTIMTCLDEGFSTEWIDCA